MINHNQKKGFWDAVKKVVIFGIIFISVSCIGLVCFALVGMEW